MRLSARNQLQGTVKSVTHGAVNSEIVLALASGDEITAIITRTSAESLGLAAGSRAWALVKASNVLIATE